MSQSDRQMWFKAAAILCAALSMRTLFPSVSTLLPEISEYFQLSDSAAGYLTMLPVLCLGVFAPVATWLTRNIGPGRGLTLVIGILAFSLMLRAIPNVALLFVGTLLGGAAIATANVLVPVLVKRDFAAKMGLMTGLYTTAICGGSAVAAAATVPFSKSLPGGWASAIGIWALPAALATAMLAIWYGKAHAKPTAQAGQAQTTRVPLWRQRLAWEVTVFMGLQSSLAFSIMGWLSPILRQRGMGAVEAGLVVSILVLTQMAGCLVVPSMAIRSRTQQGINVVLIALAVVGLTGLMLAPLSTAWLWAIPQGIAQGGLLASALTIIVLRSPSTQVAAGLSALAQCFGYMIAAMAPALIGMLLPMSGGLGMVLILFYVIGAALLYSGWRCGRAVQLRES